MLPVLTDWVWYQTAQEGWDIYCRSPCEPCFAVLPKHRKYGVHIYVRYTVHAQVVYFCVERELPELLLRKCFENR